LLEQVGIAYLSLDVDVEECPLPHEMPLVYVQRVAADKALAGITAIAEKQRLPVLAADTSVVIDGQILGKPENAEQGIWMLKRLSGRTHEVYSAVTLCAQTTETRVSVSQVTFREMSEAEILAYWHSGEPADKAGSYAIQGRGAQFIKRLEGSYSGVMGLPLFETAELLRRAGIEIV
jgi:septum formation protein